MRRLLRRVRGKTFIRRNEAASRIGLREVYPDDTFIVSFPKSGNTWARFLIASMQYPKEDISFRNIERYVPDIYKSRRSIETMPSPRIIESHASCFDAFPRFIYLLRDGRDAMISYYHYVLGRQAFQGSLTEFLESNVAVRYGTWSSHVKGALKQAETHPNRVLLVRYEDLITSTIEQVWRIENFCGLGASLEVVERAVLRSRFSALQEMERRHGGELNDGTDFRFFRRGIPGQWRDDGIEKELAPFIGEAREVLSILGYLK